MCIAPSVLSESWVSNKRLLCETGGNLFCWYDSHFWFRIRISNSLQSSFPHFPTIQDNLLNTPFSGIGGYWLFSWWNFKVRTFVKSPSPVSFVFVSSLVCGHGNLKIETDIDLFSWWFAPRHHCLPWFGLVGRFRSYCCKLFLSESEVECWSFPPHELT